METVILICLLVVIALLLHDRISFKRPSGAPQETLKEAADLPDIMGKPKDAERQARPIEATESLEEIRTEPVHSFDVDAGQSGPASEIPQEEPDPVSDYEPDWEEEEEEWRLQGEPDGEEGFATGVTFAELSTVGMVLGDDEPEPALRQEAVGIVQKLHGTELLELLENSMENAAQRIAKLLDDSVSAEAKSGSSVTRNNPSDDFDIGAFL